MQLTYAIIQTVNLEGKIPYSLTDCEQCLSSLFNPPPHFFLMKSSPVFLVDYLP